MSPIHLPIQHSPRETCNFEKNFTSLFCCACIQLHKGRKRACACLPGLAARNMYTPSLFWRLSQPNRTEDECLQCKSLCTLIMIAPFSQVAPIGAKATHSVVEYALPPFGASACLGQTACPQDSLLRPLKRFVQSYSELLCLVVIRIEAREALGTVPQLRSFRRIVRARSPPWYLFLSCRFHFPPPQVCIRATFAFSVSLSACFVGFKAGRVFPSLIPSNPNISFTMASKTIPYCPFCTFLHAKKRNPFRAAET